MSSQQQPSPVPQAGPHEQAHTRRLHPMTLFQWTGDIREDMKQDIIFSHHPTRRTRTRAMFQHFTNIMTILDHPASEETSDQTDMMTTHTNPDSCWHLFKNNQLNSTKFHQSRTQDITHFSVAKSHDHEPSTVTHHLSKHRHRTVKRKVTAPTHV